MVCGEGPFFSPLCSVVQGFWLLFGNVSDLVQFEGLQVKGALSLKGNSSCLFFSLFLLYFSSLLFEPLL